MNDLISVPDINPLSIKILLQCKLMTFQAVRPIRDSHNPIYLRTKYKRQKMLFHRFYSQFTLSIKAIEIIASIYENNKSLANFIEYKSMDFCPEFMSNQLYIQINYIEVREPLISFLIQKKYAKNIISFFESLFKNISSSNLPYDEQLEAKMKYIIANPIDIDELNSNADRRLKQIRRELIENGIKSNQGLKRDPQQAQDNKSQEL